jgi:hypothetical protein
LARVQPSFASPTPSCCARFLTAIPTALAAKAFPHQSPQSIIGRRLLFRLRTPEPVWGEIIGIAAHQRDVSLEDPGREQIYVTDGYMNHAAAIWWVLRTEGDPVRCAAAVREEIRKAGSQLLVNQLQPMDTLVHDAQSGTRFSLLLIGVFSTFAALLASVGLYGVLSTVVRLRTAEIGVRMALGATPSRIFGLFVGQGLRLSLLGIAVGVVAAFELTQFLNTMLVDVKPTDPATFVSIGILFLPIATAASWLPARRAAALNPTEALREE